MDGLTDEELFDIAASVSPDAQRALDILVRRLSPGLLAYLRALTQNNETAIDTSETAWANFIRYLRRGGRRPDRVAALITVYGRNAYFSWLRRAYNRYELLSSSGMPELEQAERPTIELESNVERVREAIASLPISERDIIALVYWDDLQLTEVADILQIPYGTVQARVFRIRAKLEQILSARKP